MLLTNLRRIDSRHLLRMHKLFCRILISHFNNNIFLSKCTFIRKFDFRIDNFYLCNFFRLSGRCTLRRQSHFSIQSHSCKQSHNKNERYYPTFHFVLPPILPVSYFLYVIFSSDTHYSRQVCHKKGHASLRSLLYK